MNWLYDQGSKGLEFHSSSRGYVLIMEVSPHKLSSPQVTNKTVSLYRTWPLNVLTFSKLRKANVPLEIKGELCAQLLTENIMRWERPMESTEYLKTEDRTSLETPSQDPSEATEELELCLVPYAPLLMALFYHF